MKRFCSLCLIAFLADALFATNITTSIGYRSSVINEVPVVVAVNVADEKYSLDLTILNGQDLLLNYSHHAPLSSMFYYDAGGAVRTAEWSSAFAVADCTVGGNWSLGPMTFSLQGGGQIGLARFYSLDDLLWSLSPIWKGELSWNTPVGTLSTYCNMKHPTMRSWKAVYTLGLKGELPIASSLVLSAELNGKAAEYMMDQWAMITDQSLMVSLTYRGKAK